MTEVLDKIKTEYPTFGFYNGHLRGNMAKHLAVNGGKVITCESPLYYLTLHDNSSEGLDYLFTIVATEVNGPIHYIKKFSTFGGLRLYLGSVMAMGI